MIDIFLFDFIFSLLLLSSRSFQQMILYLVHNFICMPSVLVSLCWYMWVRDRERERENECVRQQVRVWKSGMLCYVNSLISYTIVRLRLISFLFGFVCCCRWFFFYFSDFFHPFLFYFTFIVMIFSLFSLIIVNFCITLMYSYVFWVNKTWNLKPETITCYRLTISAPLLTT